VHQFVFERVDFFLQFLSELVGHGNQACSAVRLLRIINLLGMGRGALRQAKWGWTGKSKSRSLRSLDGRGGRPYMGFALCGVT
jgi:hypothetical protein